MKLISLNLLRGEIREPLAEFLKKHSLVTDIFLFQEMPEPMSRNGMPFLTSAEIEDILSGFNNYSKSYSRNMGHLNDMGFFVKKEISTVVLSQIRLIDAKRLQYKMGDLGEKDFLELKKRLIEFLQ